MNGYKRLYSKFFRKWNVLFTVNWATKEDRIWYDDTIGGFRVYNFFNIYRSQDKNFKSYGIVLFQLHIMLSSNDWFKQTQ